MRIFVGVLTTKNDESSVSITLKQVVKGLPVPGQNCAYPRSYVIQTATTLN
jgi:hypothetical protein